MIYRFAEFELDDGLYQLRRGADLLKLEPKTFDVLLYLVRNRDHVVTKRELLDNIWSGEFVTESVLPRAIAAIRKVLEDERDEARYVQTVHGRGYHFVAETEEGEEVDSEPSSAPEPTRRLTALLSADAVGYSRLMAEDETHTIRTLTAHMEVIRIAVGQHHGRVVDAPGDNVLAEFPTALDAVRCAVEIQGTLRVRNEDLPEDRRMPFRIGIHLGDVAVEGEQLYGDGVNIAARLEGLAEHGGIAISGTVYEQVRNKLGLACEDQGEQQVKNIPDPVRVYRVLTGTETPSSAGRAHPWLPRALVGATTAIVLIALVLWLSWPRPLGWLADWAGITEFPINPALPDRPSLVILPFVNLSGDPGQEYFADGLSDDLTAAMASFTHLFVISRSSAFTYKGKPVKAPQIGRELGVRYVLEGSVRRDGERVRINVQLIDAPTDSHVWSHSFDQQFSNIFAVQTEITEQILSALRVEIRDAETDRLRRQPTQRLSAYDAYLQAISHLYRFTRKDNLTARGLLEHAIEIDPGYADAYALLGATYAFEHDQLWTLDPHLVEHVERYTRKALELDQSLALAYFNLSASHFRAGRMKESLEASRRAVELAPNLEAARASYAEALANNGQPLAAVEQWKKAQRLSPRPLPILLASQAGILWRIGRDEEAAELGERARAASSDLITLRIALAVYYESRGKHDDAATLVEEILAVNDQITAKIASQRFARQIDPDAAERLLRAAGLP